MILQRLFQVNNVKSPHPSFLGKTSFELRHSGWQTCGISLGETIVLTGGGNEGHGHNYVTRWYNTHSIHCSFHDVTTTPLQWKNNGKSWSICNTFNNWEIVSTGTTWMDLLRSLSVFQRVDMVMPVLLFPVQGWDAKQFLAETPWTLSSISISNLQALVVAGGKDDGSQTWRSLSSVLSLSPDEGTAWTPLDPLPRPLASLRGSIVGNLDDWVFRVVGGYNDGSRNEVKKDEWRKGNPHWGVKKSPANFLIGWGLYLKVQSPSNPHTIQQVLEYRPSEGWIETGKLQTARYRHTVVSVGPQHFPCLGILVWYAVKLIHFTEKYSWKSSSYAEKYLILTQ